MENITVQQWLDFFFNYPSCAQIIASFARKLFYEYYNPDKTEDIEFKCFDKASQYFRIPHLPEMRSIDSFLVDKGEDKDLDGNLYKAIHRYQMRMFSSVSQDSQMKVKELVNCLEQRRDSHNISFLDVKSYMDIRKDDCFNDQEKDKFLDPIKTDIVNKWNTSSIDDIRKGVNNQIAENLKRAATPEDHRNKYNNFFSEDFYEDLSTIHKHASFGVLFNSAKYCGYSGIDPISSFLDDLQIVFDTVEKGIAVLFSPVNIEIVNNALSYSSLPLKEIDDSIAEYVELLRSEGNVILQGAPGVGKTYMAQKIMDYFSSGDDTRVAFTTFHQSLDYEDFVEGIHAKTSNGQISYEREDGIFKRMALEATKRPTEEFLLVIDEINRGNVSKIFGELISLIEFDKRELGKYPLHATLPYSRESFVVPSKLYILGTMNTTDRSVGSIDYALRRRFSFRTVKANRQVIEKTDAQSLYDSVEQFINSFKTPEILNPSDIMVGHGYFKDNIDKSWEFKIKPLLEEYINDGLLKKEAYDQLVGADAQGFIKKIKNYNTNKK